MTPVVEDDADEGVLAIVPGTVQVEGFNGGGASVA